MKIKALQDNIVVRLDEKPTKHGVIELPQNAATDPKEYATGVAIDVGPGREEIVIRASGERERLYLKPSVNIGDRVMMPMYEAASRIKDKEGRDIIVVRSYNLLAVIEE